MTKALTGDMGGLVQAGMILLPLLRVLRPQDESHGRLRQKQVQEDLHPRHGPWGLVLWHLGPGTLEELGLVGAAPSALSAPALTRPIPPPNTPTLSSCRAQSHHQGTALQNRQAQRGMGLSRESVGMQRVITIRRKKPYDQKKKKKRCILLKEIKSVPLWNCSGQIWRSVMCVHMPHVPSHGIWGAQRTAQQLQGLSTSSQRGCRVQEATSIRSRMWGNWQAGE